MPAEVFDERLTRRFTFAPLSHADTADWLGGKARSGEGWHVSILSSRRPSHEIEEMGDFVSETSSSLSISRATELGLEKKITFEHRSVLLLKIEKSFTPEVTTVRGRTSSQTVALRGG